LGCLSKLSAEKKRSIEDHPTSIHQLSASAGMQKYGIWKKGVSNPLPPFSLAKPFLTGDYVDIEIKR
jgi:hypothetical protein